jgi:hypothetical protein
LLQEHFPRVKTGKTGVFGSVGRNNTQLMGDWSRKLAWGEWVFWVK